MDSKTTYRLTELKKTDSSVGQNKKSKNIPTKAHRKNHPKNIAIDRVLKQTTGTITVTYDHSEGNISTLFVISLSL